MSLYIVCLRQRKGCKCMSIFVGYRLCRRPLVHRPSMSKPFHVSWASPVSWELTLMGRRLSGCWLARSCRTHMHATSAHARVQSAGSRICVYVYVCMCVAVCICVHARAVASACARAHVHLYVLAGWLAGWWRGAGFSQPSPIVSSLG